MTKEQAQWFLKGQETTDEAFMFIFGIIVMGIIVWGVWRAIDERIKRHPDW